MYVPSVFAISQPNLNKIAWNFNQNWLQLVWIGFFPVVDRSLRVRLRSLNIWSGLDQLPRFEVKKLDLTGLENTSLLPSLMTGCRNIDPRLYSNNQSQSWYNGLRCIVANVGIYILYKIKGWVVHKEKKEKERKIKGLWSQHVHSVMMTTILLLTVKTPPCMESGMLWHLRNSGNTWIS